MVSHLRSIGPKRTLKHELVPTSGSVLEYSYVPQKDAPIVRDPNALGKVRTNIVLITSSPLWKRNSNAQHILLPRWHDVSKMQHILVHDSWWSEEGLVCSPCWSSRTYPAPPAISAGDDARELIRKYLSVDPKMTVTELLMGNDIQPSVDEADICFYNPNYLKHILREERKKSTIVMQGIRRLLIHWIWYLNSTGSYWIRTKTSCVATFIKAKSAHSLQSASNLPSWKSLVVTP